MELIEGVSPIYWATVILISATAFTILWALDAVTHKRLVKVDITDKELQTHRNILVVSVLMEMSLVSMYWWNIEALPFFITFLIVRTVHEFIDELHFHTDRCSVYESRLHLGMWLFVFIKTISLFMWGFFEQFSGVEELPLAYYIWGGIVFSVMSFVSLAEWKRG
tara:strand:+ start:4082 stop:4576 length:495 start_codon:yes stop_codon:yes gene_type:complete